MKATVSVVCTIVLWSASICITEAWSGGGHMVIAAEAWRELSPESKAKVAEVLKAHPDYEKWKAAHDKGEGGLDLGEYLFLRASTWPDEIRRRGNGFDHPHWHYVDYPLIPPSFPMKDEPEPNDDIVYGLQFSEKALSDEKKPAEERKIYYS